MTGLKEKWLRTIGREIDRETAFLADVQASEVSLLDTGSPGLSIANPGDPVYPALRETKMAEIADRLSHLQAILARLVSEPEYPEVSGMYRMDVDGRAVTINVNRVSCSAEEGIMIHWMQDGKWDSCCASEFFCRATVIESD